ncbi:glyoxalase [Longimonas halophila]|uniref:Glyoxalase n=1 Tax=Longimonas halophila TaxID=1469170 RepID=A0A2H3P375_9BACT|nr:VOC family protein [Longimonas halophila]PEN05735.1 glyoxalase [Longimonas halophila]
MPAPLAGLHHITAITGTAQAAIDFYSGILGLRLVKVTVNFDDPSMHHLYFGDARGTPGTLLTVFAQPRALPGQSGPGVPAPVVFSIMPDALSFWRTRLSEMGYTPVLTHRFGTPMLRFQAHDLMSCALVPSSDGTTTPWTPAAPFESTTALQGLHSVTLPVPDLEAATAFFVDVLGWSLVHDEYGLRRMKAPSRRLLQAPRACAGRFVDLSDRVPPGQTGTRGPGVVHHIAFRVPNASAQRAWREALMREGIQVSEVRNRTYFQSIYFQDPTRTGGTLFEIATDGPGFMVDEPFDTLGHALQLPERLADRRSDLAATLPNLDRTVLTSPPTVDPNANPPVY